MIIAYALSHMICCDYEKSLHVLNKPPYSTAFCNLLKYLACFCTVFLESILLTIEKHRMPHKGHSSSLENSKIKFTESVYSAVDIVILELGYVLQTDGGGGGGWAMTRFDLLNCQSGSLAIDYATFLMLAVMQIPSPSSMVNLALHLSCIMFLENYIIQANQDEKSFHLCFRCKSSDSRQSTFRLNIVKA